MTFLPLITATVLSGPALAGSISTAGVMGGPDSGAATSNPAAVVYNPAAMAGSDGVDFMFDLQATAVRIEATTTRNGGIDPNTGEKWKPATANVVVPNGIIGLTWKAIPDRLALGIAANDPFVGGGDYSSTETGTVPPYTGHQRYHIIETKIITAAVTPALALTTVKGVHLGGGVSWVKDIISVMQASDPYGTEGIRVEELDSAAPTNPYVLDTYLSGDATGSHWGWNAGLFIDRWERFQLGLSYAGASQFHAEGDGNVDVAEDLNFVEGRLDVPAKVTVDLPLPAIARGYVNVVINDKLNVGAGVEWQLWNECCGGPDGDIAIGLTNTSGEAIGSDDGVAITIAAEQYSPRRLWNAMAFHMPVGFQANDRVWVGGRVLYNQYAVPSYAVSPSNLDFENVGVVLGGRYRIGDALHLGLNYSKFFLFTREVTDSAWNLQDGNERFSPETPYKASTNGTYSGKADSLGLRIGLDF